MSKEDAGTLFGTRRSRSGATRHIVQCAANCRHGQTAGGVTSQTADAYIATTVPGGHSRIDTAGAGIATLRDGYLTTTTETITITTKMRQTTT